MKLKVRKGQAIETLQSLVAPILGVLITLVIGFLIFSNLQETSIDKTDSLRDGTVVTWSNNTYVALDYSSGSVEISCIAAYNNSNNNYVPAQLIGSENYTCDTSGFKLLDNAGYGWNTTVHVNYSYKTATGATNGTRDVTNATQDVVSWIPILIIVIIGIVIVGLVALFRRQ